MRLAIWSEAENIDQLDWAMQSLKDSMTWDEQTYGREYDLDVYHIVAVNDFNMGAMENKGLNVFNTAVHQAMDRTARRASPRHLLLLTSRLLAHTRRTCFC